MERQESNYERSLIEASLDPLFTINPLGKIKDVNEATLKATGKTRQQLLGTDIFIYFTEPDQVQHAYKRIFSKGFITNHPLTIKDGKETPVLCNGSVYKDEFGIVQGALIIARDMTEQKRITTELIEAKIFAEKATRIAEDAVKAKQQFLSNMSHEIRTPMNSIIGFTKVVLKTNLSEKQREYIEAIKVSGAALIVLINDILDLAKVDSGKMSFEERPFKMSLSISAMLHLFDTKIQEKNLILVKEYDNKIPQVLVGDSVRLHQIILNLVSNAVKFTMKGEINVNICLLDEDEEKVTIEFAVKDTGIGIPEDKIQNVFNDFQQAHSDTSRLYGGTGLGLAIVKQLVEAQGGKIAVKSTIGEGSTFSFILSFKKTDAQADVEPQTLELDDDIKNLNILVVEDILLNQLLMKTLLDEFGFQCDIAANGRIAIEKLREKSYDLILMDLQMPEMNGYETTDFIRKELNSTIPIIALTADVTRADIEKCKAIGMNDYISKPVDEKLLYNRIVGLIKEPILRPSTRAGNSIQIQKSKCIDLDYLNQRTKSDRDLMMKLISLYLEQTPQLILKMTQSFKNKDWLTLASTVHKIIPSFSIVGIHKDYEQMAKKIHEYASIQKGTEEIEIMIYKLETICRQACEELEKEFNTIKNSKNEYEKTA